MSLRKRCVAFGDLSRAVTLLMLLLVAPLGRAETGVSGTLMFDVPEQADEQGPVTVNLLTSKIIGPSDTISSARVFVSRGQSREDLETGRTGQYCITIPPAEGRITQSEERFDEVFLQLGVGESPLRLIGVKDTDQRGGDAVDPDDPKCFPEEINNQPPVAVFKVGTATTGTRPVPDGGDISIADEDQRRGEMVVLDGSESMDPEGAKLRYQFFDQFETLLNPDGEVTITVPLDNGTSSITLVVTEDFNELPTAAFRTTRVSRAPSVSKKGYGTKRKGYGSQSYNEGYGGYGDEGHLQSSTTANITVNAIVPVANAGTYAPFADTDQQPGEVVQLSARNSVVPRDEDADVSYDWFRLAGESRQPIGDMADITPMLDDGDSTIQLRITIRTFDGESSSSQTVFSQPIIVTVQPPTPRPNVVPVITIKPTQTVVDTDSLDGEDVTLDGTASQIPEGLQASFEWFANPASEGNGTSLGTGPVIKPRLNNGPTKIRLVVTANGFTFKPDADVTVTVIAPAPASVVAVPGEYPPMIDSDGFPGEIFPLNASGSRFPTGATVTFQWFRDPVGESNGVALGTGMSITPRLKDGTTIVRLVVTANAVVSTGDTSVSVGSPGQAAQLAALPNLTPNQRRVAVALDDVCGRLIGLTSGLNGPATSQDIMPGTNLNFTADQADLANKCRGIAINNTLDNQVEAVTDLTPDDFAVARTQALLFANTQYASVLDRLIALRGGARGLSLAGLNIQVDGNTVPLAVLQEMFGKMLGGGASADATEEPGGLLSDRWGMWMRGNVSTGGRDKSLVSPSFDVDQMGIVLGTDFRLTNNAVVGASIAYLDSNIEFNPLNEGGLDTKSMALSLYGSVYAAKSFYLDALANIAKADYNAKRNISFTQGSGLGDLDMDAKGDTDGITLSAGLSGGYDFLLFKRVTFAPNAGFFYVDATIDGFAESGASGFNLLYDEQNFKSFTGNLGFRVNSTLNLPWVVLLPGLRVDYIREFNDDVDVFQVRFAADPNGNTAPPINIQTDNPDSSYWRLSLNVSAQFKFGFAGYIEYQRIDSYTDIDFQDLAFGLRMQRSF